MKSLFAFVFLLAAFFSVSLVSSQRLVVPSDPLSAGTAYNLNHRPQPSWELEPHDPSPVIHIAYGERDQKGTLLYDEGSICVPFLAFGVDLICRQVDSRFDAWGGMDQSYWKIGEEGNFVPGHQHVRADTLFTLVNGTCQFWTDNQRAGGHVDYIGMHWKSETFLEGPATFYIGRGTTFSWGCSPETHLWFMNAGPGSTGGIPFALATQVFDPSGQFYPPTRGAVERVSALYNTLFLPQSLDIVFGP